MRAKPRLPALVAPDLMGGRLRASLECLADVLPLDARSLGTRFLGRLTRLGYTSLQRRALGAITPGAAAAMAAARRPPEDFIEQVEYSGRRLAKLNLHPARIMRALKQYDSLLPPVARSWEAKRREDFKRAMEEYRFCVALALNNAFYDVAESEAWTCHELFRIELESNSLDELLSRMLQSLARFCAADAGALYLLDEAGSAWALKAATNANRAVRVGGGRVARDGESLRRVSRPRCEIHGQQPLRLALDPAWREEYLTCWSLPLVYENRLGGVMQFGFRKCYPWLPREAELLTTAAERCLLAAQKARLVEDLAAREEQIRELAERTMRVEERERRRISTELHDEAGQSLLCIRLQLEMLEGAAPEADIRLKTGLAEARALTESTIVEIRRLISALSPAVLEQLGLAPALRQLAHRLRQFHKIEVKLRLSRLRGLPRQTAGAVYRLVQECLNNVVRHSRAKRVMIRVYSTDKKIRVWVEDDGAGFTVEEALAKREAFGLAGMRERVALLNGTFQAQSQPGQGTKILLELPVTTGRKKPGPGS